jgi:stage II sporulation protein AA (anti-sigma F factor antagonist)
MDFGTAMRRVDDVCVVSLTGELDMATVPQFEQAIEHAQAGSRVIVDLRKLTFIDSTGISALLLAYKAGQNGHSAVSFVRGSGAVQRVLEMSGVEPLLAWTEPPGDT